MRRKRVTLFELGMVAVLLGWWGSVDLAVSDARQFEKAEERAVKLLHALNDAERASSAKRLVDRDGDGVGEFVFLSELAMEPHLSHGLGLLKPMGRGNYQTSDGAYLVTVYLPDASGRGISEPAAGRVSAGQAATCFAIYAWPVSYGRTGLRAFCLLSDGRFLICENALRQYGGRRHRPLPLAALAAKEERLCGAIAPPKEKSQDRQGWFIAQR